MSIRKLSEDVINRIAAGEVVERPANAVKELVENAIDSGAKNIEIHIKNGGKDLIEVRDDGCGIAREELPLAVSRHATSKLTDSKMIAEGVFPVRSLGFRGEALAAIGAVAKMQIISREANAKAAFAVKVAGGTASAISPAAGETGTKVRVEDLFYATPARLKFLKSPRAESLAISDVVKRLCLAKPQLGFAFYEDGKTRLRLAPQLGTDSSTNTNATIERIGNVLKRNFVSNVLPVQAENGEMKLTGFAGLPTFHHTRNLWQYFFINNRPVRDKLLYGALRAAYHDFIPSGRHPAVLLYLALPPALVDVNVHPTKAEVRFADAEAVRHLLVGGIRSALHEAGHRASDTTTAQAVQAMRPQIAPAPAPSSASAHYQPSGLAPSAPPMPQNALAEPAAEPYDEPAPQAAPQEAPQEKELSNLPLGLARAQLHDTYIVAQTADGLTIIDQHAAHERIVYEALKAEMEQNGVRGQMLLVPEIVEMSAEESAILLEHKEDFAPLRLQLEAFGEGAILVRELPAILGKIDVKALLQDLAEELQTMGQGLALKEKLETYYGTFACHTSIRAGRQLTQAQMDGLLRAMESTPHAGQCNHGRPTYVELKLPDIERLFGRR